MFRRPWVLVVTILVVLLGVLGITSLGVLYAIFGDSEDSIGGKNIAIIDVKEIILDSRPFIKRLKKLTDKKDIKGIVVRINSPGGVVGPSQEMYDAILEARKKKKVVASLGAIAASGGYYVAIAAEKIVANPGTLTGSIGVIMELVNLEGLYEWAKIQPYEIKSGKFKDIGSPNRPMTPEEKKLLTDMLDDVHAQFRDAVKEQRNLDEETVMKLTEGQIYSGRQAKENGLVDELGGLQKAIKLVAEMAGIKDEPKVLYPPEKKPKLIDLLTKFDNILNSLKLNTSQPKMAPMYIMGR